jgi:hypothetical protein
MSDQGVRSALREGLAGLADDNRDLGEMIEMARKLTSVVCPFATPDFECLMAPLPPTPPVTYPGVDGIERGWEEFGDAFGSVRAELESIEETDSAVLVLVRQSIVTAHGGVEMSQPGTLVVIVDGEHVKNVQFHLDRESALRAGGFTTGPEA